MKHELKVILYPELHKSKNGAFFQKLINSVFEKEGYKKLSLNVEFTGLELDLLGEHKNKKETVLIERKAKKKALSTEVRVFLCNLFVLNKADHGYFVYTNELDHDITSPLITITKKVSQ